MALQVWLPLNKENDFLNRGLADITVTNSGATYSNGKIGGCYKETSSINLNYKLNYYENSYSLCTWVKFNSDEIGTILNAITYDNTYSYCSGSILGYNSYGGLDIHWASNNIYSSGSFSSFAVYGTIRYTNYSNSTLTKVLNTDTWYHLVITFNNINKTLSFYINGELFSSITSTIELTAENKTNINSYLNIGCTSGGNAKNSSIPLYYNDVRIYDHCLSPKEVKEISKGLVLHYPLNQSDKGLNEAIFNSSVTYDSKVCHQTEASNKIYLNKDMLYTFSEDLKSTASSGTMYPSFLPYDIDGKFINNYSCGDGFLTSSKTTLAKDLNPGDTVVYCTDLTNWSTSTTNHYYMIAIFGYTDSTGYTYPDMTYTNDTPSFGSYSDKSNINKTDNTITLKSAFTGKARKAGTTICLTTDGSTYFYPFGGINVTTITDWTNKSKTLIPKNYNRLKYSSYITINCTYNNLGYATNVILKLVDGKIYDCSGYSNDGTITGTLTTSTDTPRYNKCTLSSSNGNWTVNPMPRLTEFSYSFWFKRNRSSYSTREMLATGWYGVSFELNSNNTITFKCYCSKECNVITTTSFTIGIWYHVVFTHKDGVGSSIYVNGILNNSSSFTHTMTYSTSTMNIFTYNNSSYQFQGSISDFRIYATALSEDDVKELYNTSAFITDNGTVEAYLFEESNNNKINKIGISEKLFFQEYPKKNLIDKSIFALNHYNYGVSNAYTYPAYSGKCCNIKPIAVKPNTKYVLSYDNTQVTINSSAFNTVFWDSTGQKIIASLTSGANGFVNKVAFTIPNGAYLMSISNYGSLSDEQLQILIDTLQLEEGTIATIYQSYQNNINAEIYSDKFISNQLIEI